MFLARSCLFLALLAGAFATSRPYTIGRPAKPCQMAVKPDAWPIKKELQVCGTDGVIYPSLDALECAKIFTDREVEKQERDKCDDKNQDELQLSFLSFVAWHGVCGSDNVTYNNVWKMQEVARYRKVEIKVHHEGVCKIDCPFSPIYKPVCALFTDDSEQTYSNKEALECYQNHNPYRKLSGKHDGACAKNFELRIEPVNTICATNGFTYNGVKEIRNLRKFNPKLRVMHDGACTPDEVKGLFSADQIRDLAGSRSESSTICGSDNSTYHSVFAFLAEKKAKDQDLRPVKCEAQCDETTKSNGTSPICGTDGVTYPDEKTLKCNQTHDLIFKDHDGPCSPTDKRGPCKQQLLHRRSIEVCATNGITYTSKEAFWCAALTDPKIKILHRLECISD